MRMSGVVEPFLKMSRGDIEVRPVRHSFGVLSANQHRPSAIPPLRTPPVPLASEGSDAAQPRLGGSTAAAYQGPGVEGSMWNPVKRDFMLI